MSRRKGPRTQRECTHPMANHKHGTSLAYKYDRCRCEPCTNAASTESLARARQKAYGRLVPVEWVDAAPARQRVQNLMADGYPLHAIAGAAGLDLSKITRLVYGLPSAGAAPTEKLRAADVQAVLQAVLNWRDMPDRTLVPAIGSQRRIRALSRLGWPANMIAQRIGTSQAHLSGIADRKRITAAMARAVAGVYDQLAMTPAPESPYTKRLRTYAKKRGWAPPLAWDEHTIDDPAAEPDMGEAVPRHLTVVEDAEHLMTQGVDPWRIHERTGHATADNLRTALRRADRHDLASRVIANPWEQQDKVERSRAA